MRRFLFTLSLVAICYPALTSAQLVVFDNSHSPGDESYGAFIDSLESWGYTVEKRTSPLMSNTDADILVLLPEDAYTSEDESYSAAEAAWIKGFVDSGKGLYASICPSNSYWAKISEIMDTFGIAEEEVYIDPVYYNVFAGHTIFDGVSELGDAYIYCTGMSVSAPCVAVASNGAYDIIACYENSGKGNGAAIWTSHYYMLFESVMDEYDNIQYLKNTFAWLAQGGEVGRRSASWGRVKMNRHRGYPKRRPQTVAYQCPPASGSGTDLGRSGLH